MEDRNSLYQYVVEMENWLEQFQYTMQELEKNPSVVLNNDTLPNIQKQLNKLVTDINYYKNTPQELHKDLMNDLQKEASALYNGYRSLLQSERWRQAQRRFTESDKEVLS